MDTIIGDSYVLFNSWEKRKEKNPHDMALF